MDIFMRSVCSPKTQFQTHAIKDFQTKKQRKKSSVTKLLSPSQSFTKKKKTTKTLLVVNNWGIPHIHTYSYSQPFKRKYANDQSVFTLFRRHKSTTSNKYSVSLLFFVVSLVQCILAVWLLFALDLIYTHTHTHHFVVSIDFDMITAIFHVKFINRLLTPFLKIWMQTPNNVGRTRARHEATRKLN